MINPAELGRAPIREPQMLNDEEVKDLVRSRIEYVVGQVKNPIRAFVVDTRDYARLFSMQGEEAYALIKTGFGSYTRVAGRVEMNRGQELAFEVMEEFGFDAKVLVEERESISVTNKAIVEKTSTYPSKTIGGLVFERVTESTVGNETPFKVEWRAKDAARRFRVGSRDPVKVA